MAASMLRDGAAIPAGPAVVDLLAWRHAGVLRVTVIAKATFVFAHDAAMQRTDPQPAFRDEVHHGNNPARSIRFSSDRAPYLNRTDVLFTGHANTYGTESAGTAPVRLGVLDGDTALVDKTLLVRHEAGGASVPLVYERAYGGPGWAENPYGVGAVEGTGEPAVISPHDPRHLAGFAPIGASWTARRRLVAGVPRSALHGEILEIPEDFAWAYFQAAPPDQWAPFLRGDEWIVMDGLHPALPRARMRLPGASGEARVYGLSAYGVAEGQPLALHADVLRIDGDEQRCTLTFRGVFPVAGEAALASLRVAAGVALPGEPIPWPDAAAADDAIVLSDDDLEPSSAPSPASAFEGTLSLGDATLDLSRGKIMPFLRGQAPAVVEPAPQPARVARAVVAARPPRTPSLDTVDLPGDDDVAPALPFQRAAAPEAAPSPRPAVPRAPVSGDMTMAIGDHAAHGDALPFGHPAPAPAPPALLTEPPIELPVVAAPPPIAVEPPAEPAPPPLPPAPEPPPPAPPPAPRTYAAEPQASPWAPAPEAPPAPPAPRPPPPKVPSPPTQALQKGLYGRFGGR